MKLILVCAYLLVTTVLADESSLLKQFSDENIQYIGSLYKELLTKNSGNFLVCPLSIQSVFALLNSGAKGNTAKEIAATLHLPEGNEKVKEVFTNLAKTLQASDEYTLASANKIYLLDSFKINDHYKSVAVDVFSSDVQNVDFGKESTINEINGWVEEKTHNKIHDLVTADVINENTVAVLINALYFQGTWLKKFQTVFKAPFKFYQDKSVLTNMMNVDTLANYFYCSDLKAKFIELPYKGGQVSITIVLPDEVDGLSAIEEGIIDALRHPQYNLAFVNVTIPKFKIESTTHLIPILKNMGIHDAFTPAADFTGIGDNQERISISEVVQKSYIEVDEEGTTAAAATAIYVGRSGRQYDYEEFLADHPFLFYLKHKVNGIFFIGRYNEAEEVA